MLFLLCVFFFLLKVMLFVDVCVLQADCVVVLVGGVETRPAPSKFAAF